jgi:L-type amino acid transporter 9
VPLIIPVVVLAISVYLIAAPIIENPQIEYLYAALFIVAGFIFYIPFVYYGIAPFFMGMYGLPHRFLDPRICPNITYAVFPPYIGLVHKFKRF